MYRAGGGEDDQPAQKDRRVKGQRRGHRARYDDGGDALEGLWKRWWRRDDGEETLERWQSFWPAEGKRNRKLGSDASVEFLTPKYKSRLERLCGWRELGDFGLGSALYFPVGGHRAREWRMNVTTSHFLRIVVLRGALLPYAGSFAVRRRPRTDTTALEWQRSWEDDLGRGRCTGGS
jgi:hypothetical protein